MAKYRKIKERVAPRRVFDAPVRYVCSQHGWVTDSCLEDAWVRCPCGRVAKKEGK